MKMAAEKERPKMDGREGMTFGHIIAGKRASSAHAGVEREQRRGNSGIHCYHIHITQT